MGLLRIRSQEVGGTRFTQKHMGTDRRQFFDFFCRVILVQCRACRATHIVDKMRIELEFLDGSADVKWPFAVSDC